MIIFKVYLSIIGFDESDKLCWKHEICLIKQKKKVICTRHYMSASQSTSGENTKIHVHIIAS